MSPRSTTTLSLTLLLALAPLATPGRSAEPAEPASPAPSVSGDPSEREIEQLEHQLRTAAMKADTSFFDKYWDEGYVRTNSRGAIVDKAEALADYKSGEIKYKKLDYEDVRIRAFGDTVVVTAQATVEGMYEKTPIHGLFRHTRVWMKRPEGWKVIVYHACRDDSED